MLEWHNAKTQVHRSNLSVFRCASPEAATWDEEEEVYHHDFPWEIEVQEHFNGISVPAHRPEFLLVGYDGDTLVAVIELRVTEFERHCFIAAVAVAHAYSGNGLAGEAIDLAQRVMAKYGITSDFVVEALIDRDNYAAQSAFGKRGFEEVGARNGYQVWARLFA